MKIKLKKLFIYIFITFLIGSLFINNTDLYNNINKAINLPSFIFPVIWSILYLLMGLSVYIISESKDINKNDAIKAYFIQLVVTSLWTLFFFGFRFYVLSFIWILLLICLVIIMILKFYKINKLAGLLNIPYLFWLIFASYLSFSIIILN
ncbi:MAG: TspO/MBR family protein [Bacilli bacterium]